MTISQVLCTDCSIYFRNSLSSNTALLCTPRVHPPGILSAGSLQETPLKNSHREVILQQPWEFRRVQLCESMQAPSGQGCNLLEKRREFIAYPHFPLLGWAGMRQQQVKNCSAKDVLLNKTLTCHKHDLALEFCY